MKEDNTRITVTITVRQAWYLLDLLEAKKATSKEEIDVRANVYVAIVRCVRGE